MKRVWNEHLDNLVRRHYPKGDIKALTERLGMTVAAVKCRAQVLGVRRKVNVKHPWTPRQLAFLKAHYADTPIEVLTTKTRHPQKSVWQMARKLGLWKSREFRADLGRQYAQHPDAVAHRFQKGQTPPNKGKREHEFRSPEAIEKCRQTQFKPGREPHNAKPTGYESVRGDYVYIKVEGKRKMVMKHRHVWEQANGPVPDGYCIAFRDGNRLNCDIDNLFLLSREENARRRTLSETPEQRKARVAKATETRNKSIRRDKVRIHWGMEPIGKLVKRW